jgi:hypothetical protein
MPRPLKLFHSNLLTDDHFPNLFQTGPSLSVVLVSTQKICRSASIFLSLFRPLVLMPRTMADSAMALSGCTVRSLAHSDSARDAQESSDERMD